MRPTRADYCEFLVASQVNFTLTYHADHHAHFSHDAINRYLRDEKLTPRLVWEHVKSQLVLSPNGYLVFDDSVVDKNHSFKIELVRRQFSGNAHGVIKGIGIVNCIYVNPDTGQYWIIDYRIYDRDGDGKTKLDHVHDMLINAVADKQLPFSTVLMDGWYAAKVLMRLIEELHKFYYCPLRNNRQVDDSGGKAPYRSVDSMEWSTEELANGKVIKIRGFPKEHKVRLFRVVVSAHRTDWIVTNDPAQTSTDATQKVCRIRWKIEQFHRELKQVTGIERCECRKARIQRNHIACAMLVWIRLTGVARNIGQTIYRVKSSLLDRYLCQELRSPTVCMHFA